MIYYKSEGKETIKYDVTVNFIELGKIRKFVLERYTEATKVSCTGSKEPMPKEGETITDLKSRFLYYERMMPSHMKMPIYRYEYISYQAPRLIYLIDQLMAGNVQVISGLQSPQESLTKKETMEKNINSMFPIQATTNFDRLISYIREYKEHVFLNNRNLKYLENSEILAYYPKVLECIQMKEVSRVSHLDLDNAIQFFKGELGIVLEELESIKQDLENKEFDEDSQGQVTETQKKIGCFPNN